MASNQQKYRNLKTEMNRLTVKTPYSNMISDMQAVFSLRGIAKITGIHYSTLRRIHDSPEHTYCQTKHAAIIDDLHQEFLKMEKVMEEKRGIYAYF